MSGPTVAVFATPSVGHVGQLRPLVAGLAARGAHVVVYTGRDFAAVVQRDGGTFADLYGPYPLEAADDESLPIGSRFVTFAAHYAEQVVRDVAALRPALVLYDTFAVIARVVAHALEVPYVNVSAGHNVDPERFVERLRDDPDTFTSERCRVAVEVLRERHGLADASPFAHLTGLSPHLNICSEPEEWLTQDERRVFEPVAFFGSLPPARELDDPAPQAPGDGSVLVSFGTVPWWYYADEALAALEVLSRALARVPERRCVMSLGGAEIPAERVAAIERKNVTLEPYLDLWRALREADVFVTSNGMNSTHEAIYRRVPMLSYPFFSDQPALAQRCHALGIARPLAEAPRAPLHEDDVLAVLEQVRARREEIDDALERARAWELKAVAGREAVLDRITGLIG